MRGVDRNRTPKLTKAAFPCWEGRIAPLFDTARELHVVEAEAGKVLSTVEALLPSGPLGQKAASLAGLGVETLVCGAISRQMKGVVASFGINVVSFVSGERDDVVQSWLRGGLDRGAHAMPGCGGRRRNRFRERTGGGGALTCLCPACGHVDPHERGIPCVQRPCPVCGTAMRRAT
jgi:predicted Fe-Mo cluster-binding NifX family protein